LPEHCVAPGVQLPVHAPLTHADPEQVVPAFHVPLDWQVWTLLPEHCVAPGVQTPVHAPEAQT
jgi:hypothetical protein